MGTRYSNTCWLTNSSNNVWKVFLNLWKSNLNSESHKIVCGKFIIKMPSPVWSDLHWIVFSSVSYLQIKVIDSILTSINCKSSSVLHTVLAGQKAWKKDWEWVSTYLDCGCEIINQDHQPRPGIKIKSRSAIKTRNQDQIKISNQDQESRSNQDQQSRSNQDQQSRPGITQIKIRNENQESRSEWRSGIKSRNQMTYFLSHLQRLVTWPWQWHGQRWRVDHHGSCPSPVPLGGEAASSYEWPHPVPSSWGLMTVCDLGWGDLQQKLCWSDLEYTKTYIPYGGVVNLCPGRGVVLGARLFFLWGMWPHD